MPDQTITCCDCGNPFFFTEGEQEFYKNQKPAPFSPPKRCKPCRQAKKARNEQAGQPLPPPDESDSQQGRNKGPKREKGHW